MPHGFNFNRLSKISNFIAYIYNLRVYFHIHKMEKIHILQKKLQEKKKINGESTDRTIS